jgi:hypothetical protein
MGASHLFRGDELIYSHYEWGAGDASRLAENRDILLYSHNKPEGQLYRWHGWWGDPIYNPELLKHYKTLALLQAHPGGQS